MILVLAAFVTSQCGKDSGTGGKDSPENSAFGYEFEENGCKTGRHAFDNKQTYCEGLRSKQLNKGCAYSTRKSYYERDCGGAFLETP